MTPVKQGRHTVAIAKGFVDGRLGLAQSMKTGCWQTRHDLGGIDAQSATDRHGERTREIAVTQAVVPPLLQRLQLDRRHLDLAREMIQGQTLSLTRPTQQFTSMASPCI